MAINLIPYGQLPNGNYGINLDNTSGDPRAAALEILDTLPSVSSSDNFEGRLVYSIDDVTMYVYTIDGTSSEWVALEGVPATVGLSDGSTTDPKPPVTGSETAGELYWTTDTEVLFVWDGLEWQAAGGRYATTAIENRYVGDGNTGSYSLGVSSTVESSLVEVFIDGVRQNSLDVEPSTGDYSIVGTGIVFVVYPVLDAEILTRAFQTIQISQTARVFESVYTAGGGQTEFETGVAGSQKESILVSVDGLTKTLDVDYEVIQQDTTISSIIKAGSGAVLAEVITIEPHGITATQTVVEIGGALEPEYNDSFSVDSITDSITYNINVLATDPVSATPDPILYFSPAFIGDKVVFFTGLSGGELVDIKSLKNIVTSPSEGEANELALVSGTTSGRQDIVYGKTGINLQVKGLAPGSNVSISDNGTDLVITAATGANFENRIGANGGLISPGDTVSYVGVLDTNIIGANIVVDLSGSGSGGGSPSSGRKITIKDEGGSANTRNIEVVGPSSATFDGAIAPYIINFDRGSVTLVFDSSNNWNVTAKIE